MKHSFAARLLCICLILLAGAPVTGDLYPVIVIMVAIGVGVQLPARHAG